MSQPNVRPVIFTEAGLEPTSVQYVRRAADDQLLESCLRGEHVLIEGPRQKGKTSLLNRVAHVLRTQHGGVVAGVVSPGLRGSLTDSQWVNDLLERIVLPEAGWGPGLNLDVLKRWHSQAGEAAPFTVFERFFGEVLLPAFPGERVVLLLDEADAVPADLRDAFFHSLRQMRLYQATSEKWRRLAIVCAAYDWTRAHLVSEASAPFNTGETIRLEDFERPAFLAIAPDLFPDAPEDGGRLMSSVYDWTSGQPGLTSQLLKLVAKEPVSRWSAELVAGAVREHFKADTGPHLEVLAKKLLTEAPPRGVRHILSHYRRIAAGQHVRSDKRDATCQYLLVAGLVRGTTGGRLEVSNRVYRGGI